jgi:glycosyltransferase involved in cell wall biosynthesis
MLSWLTLGRAEVRNRGEGMRRRVCLFTASPEPSGVGTHMLALAEGLRDRYDVTLGCIPYGQGERLLTRAAALGVETLPLDGRGQRTDPEIERLRSWLRASRADVFHLHAGVGWEGHTSIYAAREVGVPVIIRTEHLPDLIRDPEERISHQRLLDAVNQLICVSDGSAHLMRRVGMPATKIAVVRNGVPPAPDRHDAAAVLTDLHLPAGTRLVLTVARFSEQKGHRFLLQAIPTILAACPEVQFLWVGLGLLEKELRREVQKRGLEPAVRFLGWRDDVPTLLAAADLVVLPSLFEGLPLFILEAMAAGRPVVATSTLGTDEAVVDDVTGRLVPPGNPQALAAGVLEVLTYPELAARWGAAGRERWRHEFTAERMVRQTVAVYEDLLCRHAPMGVPSLWSGDDAASWPATERSSSFKESND